MSTLPRRYSDSLVGSCCSRCHMTMLVFPGICGKCQRAEEQHRILMLTPLDEPTGRGRYSYTWNLLNG